MGKGHIILQVRTSDDALPVADAHVILSSPDGATRFETFTDASGNTEPLELPAPDMALTLDESYKQPAYSQWNVDVEKPGYVIYRVENAGVVDTQTTILKVHLRPLVDEPNPMREENIVIPPMLPVLPAAAHSIPYQEDGQRQAVPSAFAPANPHQVPDPAVNREVFIPDFITVHLGAPTNTSARNVRVPFIDYIKNVNFIKRKTHRKALSDTKFYTF